jgi:GDP-L-fucose synthase
MAQQPVPVDTLLNGTLHISNEPNPIPQIVGKKLCESYSRQYGLTHNVDYRSFMPNTLDGLDDNCYFEKNYLISLLVRRFHEAKLANESCVALWATGIPRREFIYVDDMVVASLAVMQLSRATYDQHTCLLQPYAEMVIGSNFTITDLAQTIAQTVAYTGQIEIYSTKPDGSPMKWIDSSGLKSFG